MTAVGAGVKYEYIWTSTQYVQYAILRLWNGLHHVQENSDGPRLPPISDTFFLSAELAEYDDAAASYHRGVIVITGFQVLIYHHVHVQVATTTGTLGFFRKLWCIQLRNVQFPEIKTNMDASWQQMPSVTEPIFVDIVLHCQWAVIISISDLGSIGFRVDLNALLSVFTLDTAKSHKILSYLLLCGLGAGGRFLLPALTGLRVSFLFCSFLHIDFYIFVLRMTDADHRWR